VPKTPLVASFTKVQECRRPSRADSTPLTTLLGYVQVLICCFLGSMFSWIITTQRGRYGRDLKFLATTVGHYSVIAFIGTDIPSSTVMTGLNLCMNVSAHRLAVFRWVQYTCIEVLRHLSSLRGCKMCELCRSAVRTNVTVVARLKKGRVNSVPTLLVSMPCPSSSGSETVAHSLSCLSPLRHLRHTCPQLHPRTL